MDGADRAQPRIRVTCFTIDYGYTTAEAKRFPAGTLMSYRRHAASEDVLADPGERDITAHVCFPALEGHGLRDRFASRRWPHAARRRRSGSVRRGARRTG